MAVPLTLLSGAAIGGINGLLITGLKIDSFIVTLSMMFVYMGIRSGISGGSPYALPDSFTRVGQNELALPFLGKTLYAVQHFVSPIIYAMKHATQSVVGHFGWHWFSTALYTEPRWFQPITCTVFRTCS